MAKSITHYRQRRMWEQMMRNAQQMMFNALKMMLNALKKMQRPYDGPARSAETP